MKFVGIMFVVIVFFDVYKFVMVLYKSWLGMIKEFL